MLSEKNSRFDEIHVAVVDDAGTVTGTQGTILEKFVGLSKASDATSNETSPDKSFYKTFLADLSEYIYAGANLGDVSAVGAGQWTGYAKQLGFTTTTGTQQIDIS